MTLPNSLSEIVTRINQGSLTEADLQVLSQLISSAIAQGDRAVAIAGDAQAATITTGDGNVVLNVVFQADGLQIAGQSVQGQAVETLRQLLQGSLPAIEIDWPQVSRSLLNEQIQRLTTNPLTHAEGITYRTEQVYVPLGLVERKKVSRRGEDVSPEQGSLLYEETEITRKFEHEDFLEQVLRQGQSPRSGGRRIAVIGEPGAGKTTLLQQMARWVAEKIEGAIVIWVSLADLQGRSVEEYLLEKWLPAVVQQQGRAEASTLVKDAFVAQVNGGRVWLLLDGVDEMPVATGNPLGEMERQVRVGGLLGQMRIVLTCRLNLWDGDQHALEMFDVYRTLEFAYPGQVEQFVGQWFGALPEAQEGQAKKLCEALEQPGKERLRDLVKNPLRLTLLCFNWYLGEGTLPETKAGLYEQFVADFYEWKRERFPTTAKQQRQLNAALGELAREAIDKEETRFRLRHDFVCEFLGEPDEPDSLFQMALQLGWLNQAGVDTENRRKAVYAFFHPTFQEYFAALSIEYWEYFLPREYDDKNCEKTRNSNHDQYRVFRSVWREVILLWVGKHTNKPNKTERDDFIDSLLDFYFEYQSEIIYNGYEIQALCLACLCLREASDHSRIDEAIDELIEIGLAHWLDDVGKAVTESMHLTYIPLALKNLQDRLYIRTDGSIRVTSHSSMDYLLSHKDKPVGSNKLEDYDIEDFENDFSWDFEWLEAARIYAKIGESQPEVTNFLKSQVIKIFSIYGTYPAELLRYLYTASDRDEDLMQDLFRRLIPSLYDQLSSQPIFFAPTSIEGFTISVAIGSGLPVPCNYHDERNTRSSKTDRQAKEKEQLSESEAYKILDSITEEKNVSKTTLKKVLPFLDREFCLYALDKIKTRYRPDAMFDSYMDILWHCSMRLDYLEFRSHWINQEKK
jgi:energy-coupling factor transporter ATP-binding protein EcfA2